MPDQDTASLAAELRQLLSLAAPPIGIAFRDTAETPGAARIDLPHPPPTEDGRTGAVPAPCVFWGLATERVFATVEADHGNCSVGMYTHGFIPLAEAATKADADPPAVQRAPPHRQQQAPRPPRKTRLRALRQS
jgi:hypothetical protein